MTEQTVPIPEGIPEPVDIAKLQAVDSGDEDFVVPNHRNHGRARRAWERQNKEKAEKPRGRATSTTTIPNRKGQFVEPVTRFYAMIGAGVAIRDPQCGLAIMQAAPDAAKAWDEIAYKNEAVRRALWALAQTTTFGELFAAHVPILLAVGVHHIPKMRMVFENLQQQFNPATGESVPGETAEGGAPNGTRWQGA